MKLAHVLSRSEKTDIDLDRYNADKLKRAARFWVGKGTSKFHKAQSIAALKRTFNRKTTAKRALAALQDEARLLKVLGSFPNAVL